MGARRPRPDAVDGPSRVKRAANGSADANGHAGAPHHPSARSPAGANGHAAADAPSDAPGTPDPGVPVPLIYNPAAGGGRGGVRFREAEALFALRGIALDPVPTTAAGHATELARELSDAGHALLYVMGGDGTLSEACEGVLTASRHPLLGFIPSGTGNDFLREFGFHDRAHAIDRISMGRPRAIDAARVRFEHGGEPHVRHWINVLGTGFAAQAAELTNRRLKWAGHNAYNIGVLLRLVGLRDYPTRVVLDGVERSGDFPLVMVCNSVHTGGAMKMAPMARPDDGLLDVLTVESVNRRELVSLLMKVRDGTHVRNRKVRFDRVKRVRIEPEAPSPVLVDGEVLGATPIDVEVLPGALQVLL